MTPARKEKVWWGCQFAKIWGTLIEYFGVNTYIVAEINVPRGCYVMCVLMLCA